MEELTLFTEKYYILLIILSLWSIPWKGFALWKSSRRAEKIWFIFFLLVNTAGILEIFYLFIFKERKKRKAQKEAKNKVI